MVPLAHSAVLKNYIDVIHQLKLNPYKLLSAVGLQQSQLSDAKQRIPVEKAISLLEHTAEVSGCDVIGLKMAEQRELSDFGEISLLLSYQNTLRQALMVLLRYRNQFNNALGIYIEEVGNTVIIREEVVTDSDHYSRQSTELALGIMHRFCASLLPQQWKPLSVHFTHNAPQDLSVHRRVFGCSLEFSSEFNGIVCTTAILDACTPTGNLAMADHAQKYLDSVQNTENDSIIADIRKSIYLLLPMGKATIEQVAHTHGVNVRTLQRRLEASQTSFSILVNEVRCAIVFRYLNNLNYSLGQISDILGYSMPSSFTRWFISQFGTTPVAWRNHNK